MVFADGTELNFRYSGDKISGKATLKVQQMHKPDQAIASRRAPGSEVFARLGSTKNRPNEA